MSSDPATPEPNDDAAPTDAPAFELACLYDCSTNPSELIVFSPAGRRMATEWLAVDRATAVSLADVR
jgi:hypothetical protein